MPWAKLTDSLPLNGKLLGVSKDARLLYLLCLPIAVRGRLDGNAVRGVVAAHGIREAAVSELTQPRPGKNPHWYVRDEAWYEVHDWREFAPPEPKPSRSDIASLGGQQRASSARRLANGQFVANKGDPPETDQLRTTRDLSRPVPSRELPEANASSAESPLPSIADDRADVQAVFDHYCTETGRNPRQYKLTPARKAKIRTRLKTFGVDVLQAAISEMTRSDFHMEKGYTDLVGNCLKTDEKVEWWMERRRNRMSGRKEVSK